MPARKIKFSKKTWQEIFEVYSQHEGCNLLRIVRNFGQFIVDFRLPQPGEISPSVSGLTAILWNDSNLPGNYNGSARRLILSREALNTDYWKD